MKSLRTITPEEVIDFYFSQLTECVDDFIYEKVYDCYVVAYCEDAQLKITVINWDDLVKSFGDELPNTANEWIEKMKQLNMI